MPPSKARVPFAKEPLAEAPQHLLSANWLGGQRRAADTDILVVGAGGIGCELLKNLVLAGFKRIVLLDLDTIDVTNLNRQFLFQRQHVGKSKSKVARETAITFAAGDQPEPQIEAIMDDIMTPKYGVSFFKRFSLVLNALDNRSARSHVNRMCLAADIPLVESGTAGYLGQVTVIRKGKTECYDCQPKPHQKTFPGCTIRNTPSEPVHCIVWAKHLFNQLFGEEDPDQDVSPDAADPELSEAAGNGAAAEDKQGNGDVKRVNTRQWAEEEAKYDPGRLFDKFFKEDVEYLLKMEKLWEKRRKPEPLGFQGAKENNQAAEVRTDEARIRDQRVWTIHECAEVFASSIEQLLEEKKKSGKHLIWDKDDEAAMDFVTACANVRSHVFGIDRKSRFDIKSMAGNIIPAIATTNAVIAGLIVVEAIKILAGDEKEGKTVYLTRKPNPRQKVLVPCELNAPNPKCHVCPEKPEVHLKLDCGKMTVGNLVQKVLKKGLHMVAPDVEIEGRGVILVSSEEGETDCNNHKVLSDFNIADGAILSCDDFLQDYNLRIFVFQSEEVEEFELLNEPPKTPAKVTPEDNKGDGKVEDGGKDKAEDDEDILEVLEEGTSPTKDPARKRKLIEEANNGSSASKKAKVSEKVEDVDECVVIVE